MDEIDRKVDRAIVAGFIQSRCQTTYWMQWWV